MTLSPSKVRKFPIQEPEVLSYPEYFHHQEDDTIDLFDLFQTLWNWKWLIILIFILGTVGSYGVTNILPKVYEASVIFSTEDELSLKRVVANPKLMMKLIQNENLVQTILTGVIQENDLNNEITPADQALTVLLEENVIFFDEEKFMDLKDIQDNSNKIILGQKNEIKKVPDFSFLTVQHPDPETAQLLANQLPNLLNQYHLISEQDFYLKERLSLEMKIVDIQTLQSKKLGEIESLKGQGTSLFSLNNLENNDAIMAQLKSRLGEKIADKALAIASNDQDKILKIKKEIFALENEVSDYDILINKAQNLRINLKGKQKIYETLINQESFLIENLQKVDQKLSELKNRRVEILSSATLPESPIKPKTRLIVALSAVVSLFVGIFLVFVIEFIKNAKSRLKENEERLSPA
jgi:LPS O-antigen subunit length determinant protein (WzzB/FepE family)